MKKHRKLVPKAEDAKPKVFKVKQVVGLDKNIPYDQPLTYLTQRSKHSLGPTTNPASGVNESKPTSVSKLQKEVCQIEIHQNADKRTKSSIRIKKVEMDHVIRAINNIN